MRNFDPSCFSSGLKKPPVWPLQWNATLIKIGPETQPQQITVSPQTKEDDKNFQDKKLVPST